MGKIIYLYFDHPLNYDGLSNSIINWALQKYGLQIERYLSLPWWKRIFKRNPTFKLCRDCDDVFSNPPIWSMKLKTIDGKYIVKAFHIYWVRYMAENEYFTVVALIKK